MLTLPTMQDKHPPLPDDLLASGEAAKLIGVSRDTLKRWEKKGRISSRRTPEGHRRYRRGDVEALLTESVEASA